MRDAGCVVASGMSLTAGDTGILRRRRILPGSNPSLRLMSAHVGGGNAAAPDATTG